MTQTLPKFPARKSRVSPAHVPRKTPSPVRRALKWVGGLAVALLFIGFLSAQSAPVHDDVSAPEPIGYMDVYYTDGSHEVLPIMSRGCETLRQAAQWEMETGESLPDAVEQNIQAAEQSGECGAGWFDL